MTADRLTQAVRHRLGPGRLVPLGPAEDGAWIAEQAARGVLCGAVAGTAGARLDGLRIAGPAAAEAGRAPVPAPPSALPHGPVRLEAECAVGPDSPVPEAAAALRGALAAAAAERLGMRVGAVDLRIARLLDEEAEAPASDGEPAAPVVQAASDAAGLPGCAARAASSVTGVLGCAPVLGPPAPAVRAGAGGHHVLLELAVAENRRTLDVVRAARAAVGEAVTARTGGPVTVAVLVTAVAAR